MVRRGKSYVLPTRNILEPSCRFGQVPAEHGAKFQNYVFLPPTGANSPGQDGTAILHVRGGRVPRKYFPLATAWYSFGKLNHVNRHLFLGSNDQRAAGNIIFATARRHFFCFDTLDVETSNSTVKTRNNAERTCINNIRALLPVNLGEFDAQSYICYKVAVSVIDANDDWVVGTRSKQFYSVWRKSGSIFGRCNAAVRFTKRKWKSEEMSKPTPRTYTDCTLPHCTTWYK